MTSNIDEIILVIFERHLIKALSVEWNLHSLETIYFDKNKRKRKWEKIETIRISSYYGRVRDAQLVFHSIWKGTLVEPIYLYVMAYQMLLIDEIRLYSSFFFPSLSLNLPSAVFPGVYGHIVDLQKNSGTYVYKIKRQKKKRRRRRKPLTILTALCWHIDFLVIPSPLLSFSLARSAKDYSQSVYQIHFVRAYFS